MEIKKKWKKHIPIVVIQQSGYLVFYDRNTTQSFITKFLYLTPISILPLKSLLGVIHWNSKYLLYDWLIYKTSSYTIIH